MRAVKSSEGPRFWEGVEERGHNKPALVLAQRAASERWEGQPGRPPARGTRTIRMCSPGTRARLGALGVGRVKMVRAIEDQSAPLPLKENERAWRDPLDG